MKVIVDTCIRSLVLRRQQQSNIRLANLAAATVAYEIELIDRTIVNGIVALILFTCIVSPLITERWGQNVDSNATSQGSLPDTACLLVIHFPNL